MVKVYNEKTGKTLTIPFQGKVKELLKKTGHNPTTVLVVRKRELLTDEDIVAKNDKIEFRSVISGG